MIIPPDKINDETLQNLMEAFITREGTDYGDVELALEDKVSLLKSQLISGEVLITFDAASESINLVTKQDYQQISIE
ncbi:MAG: YheU family protein [Cellvibrionaceae bacterium]